MRSVRRNAWSVQKKIIILYWETAFTPLFHIFFKSIKSFATIYFYKLSPVSSLFAISICCNLWINWVCYYVFIIARPKPRPNMNKKTPKHQDWISNKTETKPSNYFCKNKTKNAYARPRRYYSLGLEYTIST